MSALEITSEVVQAVLPLVVSIAAPVLSALLAGVCWKFMKKFNIQTSADQQKQLDALILRGINYAEQKAYVALKSKGSLLPSDSKLWMAISFIEEQVKASGLDKRARDYLIKLVESKLGEEPVSAEEQIKLDQIAATAKANATVTITQPI